MRRLPATSPNFAPNEINPEFVILHYTACDLERALAIFASRERRVCAHFVLAPDGDLYDYGDFWTGPIRQGAHAGVSHWVHEGSPREALNECSIGIEIVNVNGNFFPYTDAQYAALGELGRHFVRRFPVLQDPARFLGHEQIAGFRGKVDPGLLFDWERFFTSVFGGPGPFPERKPVIDPAVAANFREEWEKVPPVERTGEFWSALSARLESLSARGVK